MKLLITAGPTREPIDAVRYLGNRSSGKMGAALARAATAAGHDVTLVLGPVTADMPANVRRIDVETTAQMHAAVLREFPSHDALIMAAAVADYRPKQSNAGGKIERGGMLRLELEATEDILVAAGAIKRADQRTIGFSLEERGDLDRSRAKLDRKNLDLIVYNPLDTMNSPAIEATLLWRGGRHESLPPCDKSAFAEILLSRVAALFSA